MLLPTHPLSLCGNILSHSSARRSHRTKPRPLKSALHTPPPERLKLFSLYLILSKNVNCPLFEAVNSESLWGRTRRFRRTQDPIKLISRGRLDSTGTVYSRADPCKSSTKLFMLVLLFSLVVKRYVLCRYRGMGPQTPGLKVNPSMPVIRWAQGEICNDGL